MSETAGDKGQQESAPSLNCDIKLATRYIMSPMDTHEARKLLADIQDTGVSVVMDTTEVPDVHIRMRCEQNKESGVYELSANVHCRNEGIAEKIKRPLARSDKNNSPEQAAPKAFVVR